MAFSSAFMAPTEKFFKIISSSLSQIGKVHQVNLQPYLQRFSNPITYLQASLFQSEVFMFKYFYAAELQEVKGE